MLPGPHHSITSEFDLLANHLFFFSLTSGFCSHQLPPAEPAGCHGGGDAAAGL